MYFVDRDDHGRVCAVYANAQHSDHEFLLDDDLEVLEFLSLASHVAIVSPWQIRKALNQTGLRAAVESAVAAADQTTKDAWEFAQEFRRDNPLIAAVATALGKTDAEIDALFELAGSL